MHILIVSLGSTEGLRRADEELRASLVRAGADAALARADPPRPARTMMLTDLAWARAARAAAVRGLAEARARWGREPAVIYSSTTAALLWPRPGAIRFDALSVANRPGRHGLWQRPLERRRLEQAPLLLPWSDGALAETPDAAGLRERSLVLPVPVEPSGALKPAGERDIAAIAYAANPAKKGIDRVLAAWQRVRAATSLDATPGELVIAGADSRELRRAGVSTEASLVRVVGALPSNEYRALVRRARVFVCAPRREDYGIAQLEALADGCQLVTTPAPGPYVALPIARQLDPRLTSEDLAQALSCALHDPVPGYERRARQALAGFSRGSADHAAARALQRLA
ncbi:MAG TPA: glycosyltransferase [Solirubrobacteraceae bacterium]|nr:glycosyltransferase [Solirubrobacteraceae bacterium]